MTEFQSRRSPDPSTGDDMPETPPLRRLRLLVSALLIVLIGGMIVVTAALVIRLDGLGDRAATPAAGARLAATPVAAERIALPEGHRIVAVGRGADDLLLVTEAPDGTQVLRVFDPGTGEPRSRTAIYRE